MNPDRFAANLEQSRLDDLRKKRKTAEGDTKTAKKLDKEIDKQEDLLNEVKDFAEKLERAAKLEFGDKDKLNSNIQYTPDLNDGVVLNIAPLQELVPWKEAKKYWDELLEGKYEWSSVSKLLREKGLIQ
jgi:predicted ribosome quality control (RQC) complex YloA/Tae2 family protein